MRSEQRFEEFGNFINAAVNAVNNNRKLISTSRTNEMLSEQDFLTGLYNRRGFFTVLNKLLNVPSNKGRILSLFSIDMDKLKTINDTYGHENGDFAIQTLARAMLKYVKDNGIAARYGGDEFAFAVIGDKKLESEVKNIRLEIEQYADSDPAMTDKPYEVSASLGIAERVIDSNIDIEDMIRYDAMGGNLSNLASYSSSVNVILDERDDEMSKIDFNDERISVLRGDESVYEAQVEKYATNVTAHRPGIVSFRLDGKEQTLNYKEFLLMPVNDIKGYINNSVGAISSDLSVEEGDPVVRIAQNESQYLSVYLSNNDANLSDFAVGTLHDINIRTEGVAIDNCKVVRCENDQSGMLITFETSRCVEALLDLRTVDIEIVITETDGMRVSVSSLVNEVYAPKGVSCFCVYLAPSANASADTFGDESMFNVTIVPNAQTDEAGKAIEQQNTSVGGCSVVYKEVLPDGGMIVAFSTPNDYSNLKKLDKLYKAGYRASFVDTSTGLSIMTDKIIVSDYSGMASVYVNKQGFVEEVRVILLDNDREFAIIERAGKSSVPNLNTVIITNPKTVKPGDKVE